MSVKLKIEGYGEVLKKARENKGLPQKYVAKMLGWSSSKTCKVETNRCPVSWEEVVSYCKVIDEKPDIRPITKTLKG